MDSKDDSLLDAGLAALRAELAAQDAPRGVEKELMQAFARQFPRKRWYARLATPRRSLGTRLAPPRWNLAARLATPRWSLGASLASAALVVLLFAAGPGPQPLPGRDGAAAPGPGGGAFIALESRERIEQEPAPRMVETELPRTALAPLGVPVTPENAGSSVKAQMLVGADGQPLALRLLALD